MITPLFHPRSPVHIHPHAHHIGFAAAIVGLLSIPFGLFVVPPLIAIGLGITAVLLSLHPAPGLNARPEGWAAIGMGIMGLVFGLAQLLLQRYL
jgi:hypothetical protein